MRVFTTLVCMAVLGACYRNVPIGNGEPLQPGTRIVVHLTPLGTANLGRLLGANTEAMEAQLVRNSADSLLLSVSSVHDVRGVQTSWAGEQLSIARADVARVEERKLSRRRSFALGGGILLGALLIRVIGDAGGFGGSGEPPVVPPA
jgi:hypothetical protein